MADMGEMEMPLPDNTLPMMTGDGPFGPIEMGGMFTVVKVREGLPRDDTRIPGWYKHPPGTRRLRMERRRGRAAAPRRCAEPGGRANRRETRNPKVLPERHH